MTLDQMLDAWRRDIDAVPIPDMPALTPEGSAT
jgi:hypothetical protein